MSRVAEVVRETRETKVEVCIDLDGTDATDIATGVPFFDHMLDQLGRHGRLDLHVRTDGDLDVDAYHTVEDTGIALGQALAQALGDKAGVERFGDATVPIDESLARVAIDLSGRPYLVYDALPPSR
jgi:imidazoleglycerol-phosphate dehydratase